MKLRYPIAIEPGTKDTAYGVVIPDLPGCFSAGDTLDEAIANSQKAAVAWIEFTLDDGGKVPLPKELSFHTANPEFTGWTWAVIDIDEKLLDDTAEGINITVPRRILARIDNYATQHGESHSGFLVSSALEKMMTATT